jgi:hypothetical protein
MSRSENELTREIAEADRAQVAVVLFLLGWRFPVQNLVRIVRTLSVSLGTAFSILMGSFLGAKVGKGGK